MRMEKEEREKGEKGGEKGRNVRRDDGRGGMGEGEEKVSVYP